ncbi:MAG TPA: hypothetical protein DDW91_08085, partial [Shewanella frigidimarina]|nr:hypothetical protein [Shewanella frigidimarina]
GGGGGGREGEGGWGGGGEAKKAKLVDESVYKVLDILIASDKEAKGVVIGPTGKPNFTNARSRCSIR